MIIMILIRGISGTSPCLRTSTSARVFRLCVSLRVFACLCVSLRVSTCLYVSLRVSTCLYVSLRVSTCLYVSLRVSTGLSVSLRVSDYYYNAYPIAPCSTHAPTWDGRPQVPGRRHHQTGWRHWGPHKPPPPPPRQFIQVY